MIAGLTTDEAAEGWSALWLATMKATIGAPVLRVLAARHDGELWRMRVRVGGALRETFVRAEYLADRARDMVRGVEADRGWRCREFVLVLDPRWRRLGRAVGDA